MRNRILDRDYLEGINTEADRPDPGEDRSTGQMLTDYGLKIAEPVVTAARTVTGLARSGENEYLGGEDQGPAADVDRWLGRQQKALREEGQSQFQQNVDQSKWFNRGPDDRSAWDVWPQALASQAAGLIAPGAAALATGGGSAIGTAIAGGVMGALDSGEAINSTRDFIDQADINELKKLEPYMKFYRNNGGNDRDARHQLFKESVDLLDVAANVGANVISFGTLGHALSRMGKKVDSNMMKFLGRAAFGVVEGGAAGALEGGAGELTAQRAAVKQGRQDEIDVGKIVGAAEEAIPGMAAPVGALHAFRRGPADDKVLEGTEDYDAHLRARPPGLDSDVSTVLSQTINPTAMDTGAPPEQHLRDYESRNIAQQQAAGYAGMGAPTAPGTIDTDIYHQLNAQQQAQGYAALAVTGGEQYGPPAPQAPPAPPGPAPVPGVWGQANQAVQTNVPQPGPQYGPPAPPQGIARTPTPTPAPGGGVWASARTPYVPGVTEPYGPPREQYGPPEHYGPPRPPEPPAPPPPPPRLSPTGRLGLPTPDEFGAEEATEGVVGPKVAARTIHVTPEDAKKIRAGYRLVPGSGNLYTLETKGGKSVGRISAHGPGEGLIEVGIDEDGMFAGKGEKIRRATFDAGIRLGATEGVAPAPAQAAPDTRQPAPAAEEQAGAPLDEHLTTQRNVKLRQAPLRPGRATWHRPGGAGPVEVEILDREEHPRLAAGGTGGMHMVRYDLRDSEGRRQQGEGWVDTDQLEQAGVQSPGAGGGPRGGGGPPERGTFQEQLRAAAEQIFTPTNEDLSEDVENIIRGGVATAEPENRIKWADKLQDALDRRGRLMEPDFPEEMKERKASKGKKARAGMDPFEWDTMIHAATRVNPQEVIDTVREPPLGGGRNPVVRELKYRLEGRKARLSEGVQGRSEAERAGFRKTVAVPEGPHLVVPWTEQAEEAAPTARGERSRITAREAEAEAERNIARQQEARARKTPPPPAAHEAHVRAYHALPEEHIRAYEKRPRPAEVKAQKTAGMKTSAGTAEPRTASIDERNLRSDITAYNLRVDYFNRDIHGERTDPTERERLTRINESLHSRADRLDALRFRRGLSEEPLKATIKPLPKPPEQYGPPRREDMTVSEQPSVDQVVAWASELVDQATYRRAREPRPHVQKEGLPSAGWKGRFLISKERLKKLSPEDREKVELAGKPLRLDIRKIWTELPKKTQEALMAQDRERAKAEAERTGMPERREISWAEYRAAVARDYWKNLPEAKRTEYLAQAEKDLHRRLTDTEMRELVIREVERLHATARKRATQNLPPMPIRTGKIAGKRQKKLDRELPTEEEALDRLAEARFQQKKQESRERSGDKQYGEREEVIKNSFLSAVINRFGSESRFTDLITNIANLSVIKPPPRLYKDQPTLFQRARGFRERGSGSETMSGTKIGGIGIKFITNKFDRAKGEVTEERRAEPLRQEPEKRIKLTRAQRDLEALEDQAIQEGLRFSLSERLRRARREAKDAAEEAQLAEEAAETKTAPSRRKENIYTEKMEDYYKIKDQQIAEVRKLKKWLDFTIAKMAKDLDAKMRKEGYTGGTVTWHLPEARLKERGLKDPTTGKAAKHLSPRKHYSAGSANEKFGAYSFTADLLNIQDALNFALTGIDSLGKSTKARTAGRSLTMQWNKKIGRKGKLEMPGQVQVATRQQELQRYMGPINQMMLDFAWRSQAALDNNWEALANIRRALTTEANRGFSEESLDARLDAEAEAEAEGVRAKQAIPRADDEIGRGRSAETIDRQATVIADRMADRAMKDAYAAQRREGELANVPFAEYVKQQQAKRAEQIKKDFPLQQRRAPTTAKRWTTEEGEKVTSAGFGLGTKVHGVGNGKQLTDAQYAKYGQRAGIGDVVTPASQTTKGDYMIDPKGRLYLLKDSHEATFAAMDQEAGYNVDNEETLYLTGDNPLVRVSSFTYHPDEDDPAGTEYNHSVNVEAYMGGVTRAQKTTIDRIRAAAKEAAREGWNVNYIDEVTTGYGGNYFVNMDAVNIKDEPYRGMPLDDDTHGIEGYDAEGLPLDRRRTYGSDDWDGDANDGMGGPTDEAALRMAKDQLADEANVALFEPGPVEHSIVSKAETTAQSLDRIKEMIRNGTAGPMPERYINDDFLDQLARITAGTEVYHAPYDAVAGEDSRYGAGHRGWHSWELNRIAISHDLAPDLYARSLLHEIMHPATHHRLEDDPVFAKEVTTLLDEARKHAVSRGMKPGRGILYGLTDPHEYLSESVANVKFREFLDGVGKPSLLRRLWNAIRNTFSRVMGFVHGNTALDVLYADTSTVLGKTDKLIARSMAQIEKEGRKQPLPINPEQVARNADGRVRVHAAGGFISDAYGETQQWGKDVAKRAGYAWETRSKDRARGLNWMTQYDWTKVGPAEFRDHSSGAFDTIQKIFAEGNKLRDQDKRELGRAAKIFYGWSKGNRQRAAEGMIDESWHGYWLDRELTDRGNEHFKDDLSAAQAREEHKEGQKEYEYLAKNLNGYREFRSIIHRFSERREEAMRRERINDLVKHGTLIDPDLPPDVRQRVSEAVRDWIDTDPQRLTGATKAEQRYENLREVLERVSQKDLIKKHVDVSDPNVIERIREIRAVPDHQRLPGPYVPFTRQGRFAITGNVDIPTPSNAIRLESDINHATGEPVGNDIFVFKTEAEARAFERMVTHKYHIKQLDGGKLDIDTVTQRRAMVPHRMEKGDDPEKFQMARGKALKKLKDEGANIEDRFFVQFQRKHLYYYDNEYEANQARDALIKEYGAMINLSHPLDVFVRDGRQNEQFVGTELQRQIDHLRQSTAFKRLDEHEQSAVISNLTLGAAQYVMKRGVKQRYLPRGFVKGPSTNIMGSMDEYSAYTGRYLSKVTHQAELDGRMGTMKKYLDVSKDKKDVLAEQRVYNMMTQRLNSPTENPRDNAFNRWIDRALRWTMLDKLPGIGYFLTNATDPFSVGAPLMMGRHSPMRVAAYMGRMYLLSRKMKALRNGGRDLVEAIRNGVDMTDYADEIERAVKGEVDGARLDALYKFAFDRGFFDRSANLEYQNTYAMNKAAIDKVADWSTGIFQSVNTAIENVNRFVTLGTAYRLEFNRLTKKGDADAHNKAIKYAMDIGHEANGVYANFNTPEYFNKGPIAKLIFQFKKYPQRIMMNYIRAAMGTIRGVGQWAHGEKMSEENKERARQLVAMLITQGLLAGTLGMPTEIFSIPLNIFYQLGLSRYDWDDVQAGFRQWAGKEFGKEGGGIVSHGVLRWMTGTAIDQRLGQNALLTFGSPGSRKEKDVKVGVLNFLMGATGSSAFQAFTGLQKAGDGMTALFDGAHDVAMKRFGEASRDLIPMRFITDALEASARMYPSGVESFRGQQMVAPLSGGEALVRGVTGLQLRREAEGYAMRRDQTMARENYTTRRKQLSDEFAMSPPGLQRQNVAEKVRRFNAENPDMPPLTVSQLLKAAGTRAKAQKLPASMAGIPDDQYAKALRKRGEVYLTE